MDLFNNNNSRDMLEQMRDQSKSTLDLLKRAIDDNLSGEGGFEERRFLLLEKRNKS